MTTVRLNAFGLVTDGSEMSTIASDVTAAWTSLSSSLSGSAGMAGDDELAEDWSPDYDDAAKGCAKGTEAIASFLQGFDGLLAGTGAAYKEAELTGAGKPGTSGIEIPASTTPSASVPPSALGSNPLPGGLGELAELVEGALYAVGVVFPRGDTEKLRAAALAWGTFATDLDRAKSRLGSSLVELAASEVPQSGVADEVRTAIQNMIGEFSEAASGNEAALRDLAQNIDDTWAEIRSMLESLAIELAIDIGISVALSFVTFGVGALAGAAKATTTIARWVVKIAELIRKLKIINRIPADKFLKASSVLRKLEHGPMRWRFGAEVVKGTISGAASSVVVSARNGEEITVDSLLATLAGGVVGGVAGGGVGAGFAAAFGRRAGRHAVQPTFFRATATEAAKGAAEGAAGGVAGGYTESRIKGEDFNAGLAALFGMGAGSAMGAGGHGVGAAIDARGGTGLGFDADAALAGRDGENVSPQFLADRQASADGGGALADRGGDAGAGGAGQAGADSAAPGAAGPTGAATAGDATSAPGDASQGSATPTPGPAAAGGPSAVAGGQHVSVGTDGPPAAAGTGVGTGATNAGGASSVRTDGPAVDTRTALDTAPAGGGDVSHGDAVDRPGDGAPDRGSDDARRDDAGRDDAGRDDAGRDDAGRDDAGRDGAGRDDAGRADDAARGDDPGRGEGDRADARADADSRTDADARPDPVEPADDGPAPVDPDGADTVEASTGAEGGRAAAAAPLLTAADLDVHLDLTAEGVDPTAPGGSSFLADVRSEVVDAQTSAEAGATTSETGVPAETAPPADAAVGATTASDSAQAEPASATPETAADPSAVADAGGQVTADAPDVHAESTAAGHAESTVDPDGAAAAGTAVAGGAATALVGAPLGRSTLLPRTGAGTPTSITSTDAAGPTGDTVGTTDGDAAPEARGASEVLEASEAHGPHDMTAGASDGSSAGHVGERLTAAEFSDLASADPDAAYDYALAEVSEGARTFPDDAAADAYGRSVWSEHLATLPESQTAAIMSYTSNDYEQWNAYLRSRDEDDVLDESLADDRLRGLVAHLDAALASLAVPDAVMVERGMDLDHVEDDVADLAGRSLADDAYLSTALGTVPRPFDEAEAILHLKVPGGMHALYLESVSSTRNERELLLGRGRQIDVARVLARDGQWHIFGEVR